MAKKIPNNRVELLCRINNTETSVNYLINELYDLKELEKLKYIEIDKQFKKKWTQCFERGCSGSSCDNYIKFLLTPKGRDALEKSSDDFSKGYLLSKVSVKNSENLVTSKNLYVGQIITGRKKNIESSRTGNFNNDEDFEFDYSYFENTENERYEISEDYVTKITPGNQVTAQIVWISENIMDNKYGIVDLSTGLTMSSYSTLNGLLEYINFVWWDWRIVQQGENVTISVGKNIIKNR